jgi:hypothetical protein
MKFLIFFKKILLLIEIGFLYLLLKSKQMIHPFSMCCCMCNISLREGRCIAANQINKSKNINKKPSPQREGFFSLCNSNYHQQQKNERHTNHRKTKNIHR